MLLNHAYMLVWRRKKSLISTLELIYYHVYISACFYLISGNGITCLADCYIGSWYSLYLFLARSNSCKYTCHAIWMTFFDTDLWRLSVFQTSQPLCNIVQPQSHTNLQIYIFAIDIDMYIQSSVSVPQPEFIVVSYIVTSGIRAKKGDLPT